MSFSASTTKFKIDYYKKTAKDLEPLVENCEIMGISNIQQYNPLYDDFFVLSNTNWNTISLNHPYHALGSQCIVNIATKEEKEVPVHFKFSPLLDPIRYLIGKYNVKDSNVRNLPKYNCKENSTDKLTRTNNASYIDNFFCYLSSQVLNTHGVKHCVNYYGSYLGIQDKYKIDIADDIDYLNQSRFFTDNKGILYDIDASEFANYVNYGSRSNKNKIQINTTSNRSEISLDVEDVLETIEGKAEIIVADEMENVYEKLQDSYKNTDAISDCDSVNSSNNSEINYSTDDNDDINCKTNDFSENDSEDESENELEDDSRNDSDDCEYEDIESEIGDNEEDDAIHAYIKDFPIQIICLEKCEGTLDDLFIHGKINSIIAASIFMQIIMTLLIYQKMFYMTHNDLHTNNIMYVSTDEPYLYYQYNGDIYKVPTYGKIFKIIDFGRAIYKYNGKIFCSDSFSQDGDASTQYNCEPFFNERKPRLDPNMSFDLCRLGCSIYDFIIHDKDNYDEPKDEFQETILRWCKDDNHKNILYKRNGEERYPNFKLYKMIARTVHAHTPEAQLSFPYFAQFLTKFVDIDVNILDIDSLPSYAMGPSSMVV